jgi:hypothetical protein
MIEELTHPAADRETMTGNFTILNGTSAGTVLNVTFTLATSTTKDTLHMIKGNFVNYGIWNASQRNIRLLP